MRYVSPIGLAIAELPDRMGQGTSQETLVRLSRSMIRTLELPWIR
jgi:hypothetical protein